MPSIIKFNDTATKAVKRLTFFNALTCAIDYMYVDRGVGYYWHPTRKCQVALSCRVQSNGDVTDDVT